jgi:polyisoprenoid-binding protein YceI
MRKIIITNLSVFMFSFLLNITTTTAQTNALKDVEGNWEFQVDESDLTFKIGNLYVFSVKGEIPIEKGVFQKSNDETKIEVTIDISSISTGNTKRDDHLKSEDFFNTKKYPEIDFYSENTSLNKNSRNYAFMSQGTVEIKGIQNIEIINFNINKLSEDKISITGEATLNRLDYKINYEMAGMDDEATVKFKVIANRLN